MLLVGFGVGVGVVVGVGVGDGVGVGVGVGFVVFCGVYVFLLLSPPARRSNSVVVVGILEGEGGQAEARQ